MLYTESVNTRRIAAAHRQCAALFSFLTPRCRRLLGVALLFLLLSSLQACGPASDSFRLTGKFKNFNQGELYIYGLEGKGHIDTIRLADGKFNYEPFLEDTMIMSVVFPNYSEIPVIAVPGTAVSMTGDASHLRDTRVTGTDDNQLLTDFRLQVNEQTPPEAMKTAAAFIADNPSSLACIYVLNRYFLARYDANLDEAVKALTLMTKAEPNIRLRNLLTQVKTLQATRVGKTLPQFSDVTIEGRRISNTTLQGDVNVIFTWAVWNFDSQAYQRTLQKMKRRYGARLTVLGLCLDGNPADCRHLLERDTVSWPTVCDGRMWKNPTVEKLGFSAVPEIIVTNRSGKILARRLSQAELQNKVDELLN